LKDASIPLCVMLGIKIAGFAVERTTTLSWNKFNRATIILSGLAGRVAVIIPTITITGNNGT